MALTRFAPLLLRVKTALPAVAFFGGFIWDAATLGRSIQTLDLWILLGYLSAAAGLLVLMGRRGRTRGIDVDSSGVRAAPEGSPLRPLASGVGREEKTAPIDSSTDSAVFSPDARRPTPDDSSFFAKALHWIRSEGPAFSMQFLFGSLFSALFIFYFLSSSYLPGFLVVLALLGLLIANEFLENHYHRFTLTWALFGVCAILYLNFAIPHVMGSIHPIWFYLSTAAGVGLVRGIKALTPKAKGSLWPLYGSALALVGLFLVNAIPPVPLVKKNLAICRNLEKTEGTYHGEIESPPFYAFWRISETVVRQRPGEKIFCFTSVFAPSGLACTLYHTWRFDDPKQGWVETSRIGFPIHGGRKDGFRGFTYKRTLPPGRWQVRVETEGGRVLGTIGFRAESTTDTTLTVKKLVLD